MEKHINYWLMICWWSKWIVQWVLYLIVKWLKDGFPMDVAPLCWMWVDGYIWVGWGIRHLREGFQKRKGEKVWSFAIPGGEGRQGGSAKVVKMPYCFFGVLKLVENGFKLSKKHVEILIFRKKCQTWGGGDGKRPYCFLLLFLPPSLPTLFPDFHLCNLP